MEVQQCSKDPLTQQAVNIEFLDLTYSVPIGKGFKVILKEISGRFRSGQLTAILGPSGAGKSTLLNFLAGYKCVGATGLITVNGDARDTKRFSRISRYIMQEDILQPFLTVEECMLVAAEFKLSGTLSRQDKTRAVRAILDKLKLLRHKDTRTERLSGGEKKRLSIAMELVDNPPVIFLDEPTTGLDDSAGLQCVSLLKTLAEGGRTVVCSIHTPTAKVFGLFDHVYILSQGQCVFQGLGSDIVPFLRGIGLPCPTHYNPADFIIDVASGEYGCYADRMLALTHNGKVSSGVSSGASSGASSGVSSGLSRAPEPEETADPAVFCPSDGDCSTWKQFRLLLCRRYKQMSRDKFAVMLVLMYVTLALIADAVFYQVGNDASKTVPFITFIFGVMLMYVFCAVMDPLLNFSKQLQLIKREHFNRWYRLDAYFWANTVFSVPNHVLYATVFTLLVYGPTNLPGEPERIVKLVLVSVLVALVSETIGQCIATAMSLVNGLFLAQVVVMPLLMLTTYGLGFPEIPVLVLTLIRLNYIRYGVEGLVNAVFEGRARIPCPDTSEFCPYTANKDLMRFYMIENTRYWLDVAALLAFLAGTKALSLFMLRQRLSPNKAVAGVKLFTSFVKSRMMASR